MANITGDHKYPEQTELPTNNLPADLRLHCGFVCDSGGKLHAALGLPIKRRGWQSVALVLLAGALLGIAGLFGAQPPAAQADELPLRLHIVANSDLATDQALKLQVRDTVVEYLTPLVQHAADTQEAENIVINELDSLQQLAAGICASAGYGCTARLGEFNFPDRRYGKTLLPAGQYRALKLELGQAAGHNWWCVIFPPLCFVDECGSLTPVDTPSDPPSYTPYTPSDPPIDSDPLGGVRVVRLKICEVFNVAK